MTDGAGPARRHVNGPTSASRDALKATDWWALVVACAVMIWAGLTLYLTNFREAQGPITRYIFGDRTVSSLWNSLAGRIGSRQLMIRHLEEALAADKWVIAGYTLFILGFAIVFYTLAFSGMGRKFAVATIGALVVAVIADVFENVFAQGSFESWSDQTLVAVAATIKWCALLIAFMAVPAATYTVIRLGKTWGYRRRKKNGTEWWTGLLPPITQKKDVAPDSVTMEGRPTPVSWPATGNHQASWRAAYVVPDAEEVSERTSRGERVSALCLSGGGVRSACVAMGAMQTLSLPRQSDNTAPSLDDFDYVISVSGGGYSAGARLLAVQPFPPFKRTDGAATEPAPKRTRSLGLSIGRKWFRRKETERPNENPTEPPLSKRFERGSAEFDYLRRRASYIADSPAGLVRALAELMKNLLASFYMIFAVAVVVGWAGGIMLARIPGAAFVPVQGVPPSDEPLRILSLEPHGAVVMWAIAVPIAIAVFFLFCALTCEYLTTGRGGGWLQSRLTQLGTALISFALIVFVLTIALPGLMRLGNFLIPTGNKVGPGSNQIAAAGGLSAVVIGQYLVAIFAMARKKKGGTPEGSPGEPTSDKRSILPKGLVQVGIVLLTLTVLALVWLVTVGIAAAHTFYMAVTHKDHAILQWPYLGWILVILGILALLSFVDVTALSLFPFYRGRLARAFAVRRTEDGSLQTAQAYKPTEATWLDQYGQANKTDGRSRAPKFLFAAAAAVSGDAKPAPGLNAVSFVLSADYVGGPELGWLDTRELIRVSPARLRRALTVQSAVAISGAAFASAMGRQNQGFQTLLAASGARLGTWLPNPKFVKNVQNHEKRITFPKGLPSVRGISYFYRELFGITRDDGRLVQVTDGGHYENLGLVEALRRRCRLIVCIDSGGDAPPLLGGLADAMRLAKYELGVDITLDGITEPETVPGAEQAPPTAPGSATAAAGTRWSVKDVTPGCGTPFGATDSTEAFECLNERITKSPVLVGRIEYPDAAGMGSDKFGTLIFAKTVLWERLPYWLLTYAASKGNELFPHDPTSNQWFNEGQFAAYTELGRQIAEQAVSAINDAVSANIAPQPHTGDRQTAGPAQPHNPESPAGVTAASPI